MNEPTVLRLRKRPVDLAEYSEPHPKRPGKTRLRMAAEGDVATLVKGSTIIYDEDEQQVTVAYLQLEEPADEVVAALRRINYVEDARTSGMASKAKIIGYQGPSPLRGRRFCSAAGLEKEDPQAHHLIMSYAAKVAKFYEQFHPTLYAEHQRQASKVLPEWKIEDSPFTSGIVNRDNQLAYHHDAGNFKNVWSNMLGFKHGITGGYLNVPEYDLALEIADNSLTMFDGQGLLHGVTPFRRTKRDAYRFTVVYYALRSLWECKDPTDNVREAARKRVELEERRLAAKAAQ